MSEAGSTSTGDPSPHVHSHCIPGASGAASGSVELLQPIVNGVPSSTTNGVCGDGRGSGMSRRIGFRLTAVTVRVTSRRPPSLSVSVSVSVWAPSSVGSHWRLVEHAPEPSCVVTPARVTDHEHDTGEAPDGASASFTDEAESATGSRRQTWLANRALFGLIVASTAGTVCTPVVIEAVGGLLTLTVRVADPVAPAVSVPVSVRVYEPGAVNCRVWVDAVATGPFWLPELSDHAQVIELISSSGSHEVSCGLGSGTGQSCCTPLGENASKVADAGLEALTTVEPPASGPLMTSGEAAAPGVVAGAVTAVPATTIRGRRLIVTRTKRLDTAPSSSVARTKAS